MSNIRILVSRKRGDVWCGLFGTKVSERDQCRADDVVVGILEEPPENWKRLAPERERAVMASQLSEHVGTKPAVVWVETRAPSSTSLDV